MNYIRLTIEANESRQDIFISLLSDVGATGFEQTENTLIAYFNEPDFDEAIIKDIIGDNSYQWQKIAEQNWNALWESNFQPVIVSDFCAIRASFHEPIPNVTYELIITPKMSFGTGHHATTYMMIEQMAALDFTGKKVFDFGTGTGILAILAEKLGAAHITATDIDEWSINNALENIQQNDCRHINLYQSAQVPEETFNIVLANINKNVILQNLSALYNSTTGNGCILLSGLLLSDEEDIIMACEKQGLTVQNKEQRQNWLSLLVRKQAAL